jgi:hypothetical protein
MSSQIECLLKSNVPQFENPPQMLSIREITVFVTNCRTINFASGAHGLAANRITP